MATETEPVPEKPSVAVKVAVQMMLSVVARPVTVPPTAAMSAALKPATASEKEKETTELFPAPLYLLSLKHQAEWRNTSPARVPVSSPSRRLTSPLTMVALNPRAF